MTRTEAALHAKITAAANAGILTLAHTDETCFESVAEWLEYTPTVSAMEAALEAAGIELDAGPDIHEINYRGARQRARYASIRGA